jgi:peroxiredoxin
LSDWNGEAVAGFGVEQVYRGLRGVARRSAFLVERGGTVSRAWSYEAAEVPDVDELLEAARTLT